MFLILQEQRRIHCPVYFTSKVHPEHSKNSQVDGEGVTHVSVGRMYYIVVRYISLSSLTGVTVEYQCACTARLFKSIRRKLIWQNGAGERAVQSDLAGKPKFLNSLLKTNDHFSLFITFARPEMSP